MKSFARLCLPLTCLIILAGCSLGANPGVPKEDPALVANAEQVADDLRAGVYDAVYAKFDATMQQQLPKSKLRETLETFTAQHGSITGFGPAQAKSVGGMDAVDMAINFERGSFLLRVAYDDAEKIAGLWILAV
jgi:hypothetical protein